MNVRGILERIAVCAVLLFALPFAADADVADFLDRPIATVSFRMEGRPADERRLAGLVKTRPGGVLSMRDIRESVAHLASLGLFEGVVAHAEADGDKVSIIYDLTPVHPIGALEVVGLPGAAGLSRRALRRDIEDRFGPAPPRERAAEIAELVVDQLRSRGYLRAEVTPRIDIRHDPDIAQLTLVVEPGQRPRVRSISTDGTPAGVESRFLRRLDIGPGDPYEPDAIASRIEAYLADRRRAGYYEARVNLEARFEDDDRVVDLEFAVQDGPRIRVAFAGDPVPGANLDELVPVARESAADQDLLEDSAIRLEEYLRSLGYRDAVAAYAAEVAGGERVITFTIRRGPLYRVSAVEIAGNVSVPLQELSPLVRSSAGRPFDAAVMDADASAIQDFYRQRGFAAAAVRTSVELAGRTSGSGDEVPVSLRFLVTENVRVLVGTVEIRGVETVTDAELREVVSLSPGGPFVLTQMAIDRDSVEQFLRSRGYQRASVSAEPRLSSDGTRADVVFDVREGPRVTVGDVLIVGNQRTRTETISREVTLVPGDPLDAASMLETQRRLAALGLFRRVRVTTLAHDDETIRDLLVTVEEAPATTLGYGGGVEAGQKTRAQPGGTAGERLEVAPRAFFEIGRRNLFGKNRSVSLFTRVSLRADDPSMPGRGDDGSQFGFVEYRVLGTFREPRVFGSLADAFLSGTTEQQTRPSFNFARRAFSAEVARAFPRGLALSANYQIQRTELFDERFTEDARLIDRLFPQVRLSSFSTSVVRDRRDDQLNPTRGHYGSVNLQLAARRFGSEVGFVRSFVTAQWFLRLPGSSGAVLATSARVGLADGFKRSVQRRAEAGPDADGEPGRSVINVVEDLPASERFFAGGDTTVRGFALDQLGTEGTLDEDGFPLGGNAVTILNAELRLPLFGGLGVVGFVDAGNVFPQASDLDLAELRGAVGFGVRYASPIGPIRVDLGFKTDRRMLPGGQRERLTALHISLGQAF